MFAFIFSACWRTAGFLRRALRSGRLARQSGWLLLALLVWLPQRAAWADLMVAPTRLVFDKNQRAAQLDLINNSTEAATYRISIVNRRMSETGEFLPADSPAPGEQFAGDLLRYSPRQVVLAPGAGQVVRVMLRKPADLASGEYRSHLIFEKVAAPKPEASPDAQAAPSDGQVSVQLTMLSGLSIPVIVRHGETAATVTLSDLALLKPVPGQAALLAVVVQRSGNRSIYGDLTATFTPQGGTAQEVAKAGGVAVYTPNALRRVKLELKPTLPLTHGTLKVTLRERAESGGKLLAESAIELP